MTAMIVDESFRSAIYRGAQLRWLNGTSAGPIDWSDAAR